MKQVYLIALIGLSLFTLESVLGKLPKIKLNFTALTGADSNTPLPSYQMPLGRLVKTNMFCIAMTL